MEGIQVAVATPNSNEISMLEMRPVSQDCRLKPDLKLYSKNEIIVSSRKQQHDYVNVKDLLKGNLRNVKLLKQP